MLRRVYDWIHPKPPVPGHTNDCTRAEARAAIERAEGDLTLAQERGPLVARVATTLSGQGARNHFAEMLEASMRSVS
jgi:hypothetical protein